LDNIAKAIVVSITTTILAALTTAINRLWKKQKAQEAGLKALLHDRIYQEYTLCQSKGYATVEDIQNLEYLYKPYHELGGNGTGTELFERVKSMPPEPPKKEKV